MKSKELNGTEVEGTEEDPLTEIEEELSPESERAEVDLPEGEGPELPEGEDPVLSETEDPEDPEGSVIGSISASEDPTGDESNTLQEDFDRLQDQHLRLAAEYENYRKRVSGEAVSSWIRAQAELAASLLEGLDDLQRVSQFTTEDATLETLIEGVDLVERKMLKALTGAGLEAFDPTGEVFDPNRMEAMMRVQTEEEGQDGTVHQVFQKGYTLKDQLVRPARVSVYTDDD
jgi:molecular chaperone GrpE